jgi:hypothetical protein
MKAMKMSRRVTLLAGTVLASVLFVGCASVSLPPAKSYAVQIGNASYHAKSVKVHGDWIELETETGTVWAKGSAVTIKLNN